MSRFSPVVFRVDERCFFRSAEKACERGKTHADAADFSLRVTAAAAQSRGEKGSIRIQSETRRERLAEAAGRAKKTGNTTTEYRITADRACFFYHFASPRFGPANSGRRQTRAKRSFSTPLNIDAATEPPLFSSLRKKLRGKEVNARRRSCVFDKFACK